MEQFAGPAATLSAQATRALGDAKYDKRKSGALEVEGVVKALVAEARRTGGSCEEGIAKVCRRLANDFVVAPDPNQRKGGLIGLAAVAIGLGADVGQFLDYLLPPVLKCFDDPESRVRYYATEALYNVCKVSRSAILAKPEKAFNPIFHGLCKVFADVDPEVKNGAQLLDRLLKVIVAESEAFNIDLVVPLLQSYLKVKNPFIRQLLVSWILALDAVPDLDVVKRLPALLDGLLDMLSDGNKSIRDSAEKCIAVFLKEIADAPAETQKRDLIPRTVDIVVRRSRNDPTRAVRSTCMNWLGDFIVWGGDVLVDRFADLLRAVVDGVSETDDSETGEIAQLAKRCDRELQDIARSPGASKHLNEKTLVKVCTENVQHANRDVRETCLNWISLLLDTVPDRMSLVTDEIVPVLVLVLKDPVDEVVGSALSCLARVARNAKKSERILSDIVQLFERDRALLEDRGAFIIRRLCVLLHSDVVYLVLARIIDARCDPVQSQVAFSSLMVQTLNIILLTATELGDLRTALRKAWGGGGSPTGSKGNSNNALFNTIFFAWCHNPIAALCLSLLGGAYGLSARLVDLLGESEITIDVLVDADRLVRLLESPIMLHVRTRLLKSGREFQPNLLKALFGLLMLLPQKSEAFKTLDARLNAVTAMHMTLSSSSIAGGRAHSATNAPSDRDNDDVDVDDDDNDLTRARYDTLLRRFAQVQELHARAQVQIVHERSLLNE